MRPHRHPGQQTDRRRAAFAVLRGAALLTLAGPPLGCTTGPRVPDELAVSSAQELAVHGAVERYAQARRAALHARAAHAGEPYVVFRRTPPRPFADPPPLALAGTPAAGRPPGRDTAPTFGLLTLDEPVTRPATQPATQPAAAPHRDGPWVAPAGYWRPTVARQLGRESLELVRREFWRGFQTTFWDLENAIVLTATLGASIAIRETGVDDTVADRVRGHRQLGDMDEPIQILGHPGTHFAAAGVLWLGSTLTRSVREHEFAKALTEALAVNGVTTVLLKVATNTRAPNGERFAWPSGHTSSAFTFAAVVNEYYGPLAGIPSLALAGLVGYQRIDSRVHDFSDVVFGGMLGYIVGTSIARDQKAQFPEVFGMTVLPYADPETGASGLALLKRF